MNVYRQNISLRTFLKIQFKQVFLGSGKYRSLTRYGHVQIFTMICITYRSVNVGRERKASANKNVLVCIYLKRGRTHRSIHLKGLCKAPVAISYDLKTCSDAPGICLILMCVVLFIMFAQLFIFISISFGSLKVILCASEHICSIVRYCFRSFKQL